MGADNIGLTCLVRLKWFLWIYIIMHFIIYIIRHF